MTDRASGWRGESGPGHRMTVHGASLWKGSSRLLIPSFQIADDGAFEVQCTKLLDVSMGSAMRVSVEVVGRVERMKDGRWRRTVNDWLTGLDGWQGEARNEQRCEAWRGLHICNGRGSASDPSTSTCTSPNINGNDLGVRRPRMSARRLLRSVCNGFVFGLHAQSNVRVQPRLRAFQCVWPGTNPLPFPLSVMSIRLLDLVRTCRH